MLRGIVSEVAAVLMERGHAGLAAWLISDMSPVMLYSDLDVRDLTPENQAAFLAAVVPAYERTRSRGPSKRADPAAWEGYIHLFGSLVAQIEAANRGEIPTLTGLNGVSPHDGKRSGPGWDETKFPG